MMLSQRSVSVAVATVVTALMVWMFLAASAFTVAPG
jgi:hypothetical protein